MKVVEISVDAERWTHIKAIFHDAAQVANGERANYIRSRCGGDEALATEIEALLAAHDEASSFIEGVPENTITSARNNTGPAKMIGRRVGAYELVRELGRGGMGAVYLASRADDQFRKLVAVKLINDAFDNESISRRFRNERQILASLDHPNIARLLDGGSTEEGSPYFVMEYIEGTPVRDYCDAHRLSTNKRLRLFRDVCSAVNYSHQNLIVHRDLKPGNILVTRDGTAKLLDFGIAKLIGAPAGPGQPTLTTSRVMTPEYASPEQVRGETITTASDIYSLGVLLYELLCGHRPYRINTNSPLEVIRAVCEQEPEKPSTAAGRTETTSTSDGETTSTPDTVSRARDSQPERLRRQLEGDLDNIVLKAMRKEPQRRYSSIEQFSEDLRRYLEGLPVIARKDTFSYRTAKFAMRHKVGIAAAAFVVLILLSATAITSWEAHVARVERAKAEQRAAEMRKLSNSLLSDVQDSLSVLPGAAPTQRLLAQDALDYLDRLAEESRDDPALLGELASGYIKVGNLRYAHLNDFDGALPICEKAVDLYRRRVALVPNDQVAKRDLIGGLFGLAELLSARGRNDERMQVLEEVIALDHVRLASEPTRAETMFELGTHLFARGETLESMGRQGDARADFQGALDMVRRAIQQQGTEEPREPHSLVDLSSKYQWQGEIYGRLADWQNAAESQRKAGLISEAVWRENPTEIQALRNTSHSHNTLGEALEHLADYQGALDSYRFSLLVLEEARAKDPASNELTYGTAYYMLKVGTALQRIGEPASAVEMVRQGLTLFRQRYFGELRAYNIRQGSDFLQQVGDFFASIGYRNDALATYNELIPRFEELCKPPQNDAASLDTLAGYYRSVGNIHAGFNPQVKTLTSDNRGDFIEAIRWYQKALDTLRVQRELLQAPGYGPAFRSRNESASKAIEEELDKCNRKIAGAT